MIIRTLLADDELASIARLRRLLMMEQDIEIVAETTSAPQAVEEALRLRPDLLFLDIEMPVMNGFEVFRAICEKTTGEPPAVVFETAYPEYSVEAFEIAAHDYLLKPTSSERLRLTLARVRKRLESRNVASQDRTSVRIAVRNGERTRYISVESIQWIEAASNYVVLHLTDGKEIIRETLASIEKRLPGTLFQRISRSIIVRLAVIEEIRSLPSGAHCAVTTSGEELAITRHRRELGNWLRTS